MLVCYILLYHIILYYIILYYIILYYITLHYIYIYVQCKAHVCRHIDGGHVFSYDHDTKRQKGP
jgi:hypothetical protein